MTPQSAHFNLVIAFIISMLSQWPKAHHWCTARVDDTTRIDTEGEHEGGGGVLGLQTSLVACCKGCGWEPGQGLH